MRNVIDFDVEHDQVLLVCEIANDSCMGSCINFITSASSLTVRVQKDGTATETTLSVQNGSACYMLPDYMMRAAGTFTVCAIGNTPIQFEITEAIAADVEYTICLSNGVAYVRACGPGDSAASPCVLYNLLHNADFTQMVAQAGVSAVHGGGSTTFAGDRWELVSGTVTAAANANGNGYGAVTLDGTIQQKVENAPSTWTTGIVMVSGEATVSYADGVYTITSSGGVLGLAYLYAGEHPEALPPIARGYAAELLECQRFYVCMPAAGEVSYHGFAFSTGLARIMLPLPVVMRTSTPAYKVEWTFNMTLYPGGIAPSGLSSIKNVGSFCCMVLKASDLTANIPLVAKGNAKIELNCDL